MKFSEQWLRGWVSPQVSRDELVARLSMAGLEGARYDATTQGLNRVWALLKGCRRAAAPGELTPEEVGEERKVPWLMR